MPKLVVLSEGLTGRTHELKAEKTTIGRVEAMSTIRVKSQVDGTITQVSFTEGDTVKKDQVLFTIDPRPYQAALDQAMAKKAQVMPRQSAPAKPMDTNRRREKPGAVDSPWLPCCVCGQTQFVSHAHASLKRPQRDPADESSACAQRRASPRQCHC